MKRTFETGATRDTDNGKYDYEGFLSPLVLLAYGEYMHDHRYMKDGTVRDSDNWQKGMGQDTYMKSLVRHLMDLWLSHRGYEVRDRDGHEVPIRESLLAVMFNAMGMLHELEAQECPERIVYREESV